MPQRDGARAYFQPAHELQVDPLGQAREPANAKATSVGGKRGTGITKKPHLPGGIVHRLHRCTQILFGFPICAN
jgi:hypothetical protein